MTGTAAAMGAMAGMAAAVAAAVVMQAVVVVVVGRVVEVVVVMTVDTCLMSGCLRRWIGGYESYAAHHGCVRVERLMTGAVMCKWGSLIG